MQGPVLLYSLVHPHDIIVAISLGLWLREAQE
jgi:hypothetical protein